MLYRVGTYELGLVYFDERLVNVLGPGVHFISPFKTMRVVDMSKPYGLQLELDLLLDFPVAANYLNIIGISDHELGIEYKNGVFNRVLPPGRYAYWNALLDFKVDILNTEDVEIPDAVSRRLLSKPKLAAYTLQYKIDQNSRGVLFIGGKFDRILEAGTYYFWKTEKLVEVKIADMRAKAMEVSGQEILTKDKAAIRINFDVHYKVTDIEKAVLDNKESAKQLYSGIQLALRAYIGTMTLDHILARKAELAPFVMEQMASRAAALGYQIITCGMRDIILPGDVRNIINQVLIAQKKAQANTIMRQEETASTRSLLNTAKLMEQNEMLFRLKEMEYIERIADKIGEITVDGGGQILNQLSTIFRPETK